MQTNQQREQTIDQLASIEANLEKELAVPTQESINSLYAEMYQFMSEKLNAAKRAKKPCLFVFGETHPVQLAKSSLIVEKIAIRIANRLGIKNIYLENGPDALASRRNFVSDFEKTKKQDPTKYDFFSRKINIVNHVLRDPIMNTFNLIAAEPKRGSTVAEREKIMVDTLSKGSGSGLYLVGLKHLKVCAESDRLHKKYRVSTINTQPIDLIERMAKVDDPLDKDLFDFAVNTEKVKQFSIKAKLVETDPDLLLDRVEKADKAFVPPTSKKSSTTKLKSKLNEQPIVIPPSVPYIPCGEPKSSLASAQYPALLGSVSGSSTSLWSNVTQIDSSLVQPLIQLGLWMGSKLGYCPKPFSANFPIVSESVAAEVSASRQLCKMGMTMDSALEYLFSKKYARGNIESRDKMRKFLIDVVNGNVLKEIGEEFNALANISNAHERAKQLNKLMESTAGDRCLLSL